MTSFRLILITDNIEFQQKAKDEIEVHSPGSEVYEVASAMRAPGLIDMLKPDFVVLDASLPDASTCCPDIQASAREAEIPVVIFSSNPALPATTLTAPGACCCPATSARELVAWFSQGAPDEGSPCAQARQERQAAAACAAQGAEPAPAAAQAPAPAQPQPKPIVTKQLEVNLEDRNKPRGTGSPKADYTPLPSPGIGRNGEELPSMDDLLLQMLDAGASDLHVTNGSAPRYRVDGALTEMPNRPTLYGDDTEKIITPIIGKRRRAEYDETWEADFSYSIPGKSRFRVNVFKQRGAMGAVLRTIPFGIPSMDQLGLPDVCAELSDKPRGLVLVTGPTGSGKSTTLAAMIDYINRTHAVHIMTMEDPIEFIHQNKMALVNQREVGEDTESFAAALKHVLRQDPDVILVGEMRDLETISAAITAAETGHLVFGTLHTIGGPETIDRIIDVFPPEQQNQVRMQLSGALQGVLSQVLCPRASGKGRILAMEIMLGIPAIGNLIREGKTHQMPSIIQSGGSLGMTTLDHSLRELVKENLITPETAIEKAQDPKTMAEQLGVHY